MTHEEATERFCIARGVPALRLRGNDVGNSRGNVIPNDDDDDWRRIHLTGSHRLERAFLIYPIFARRRRQWSCMYENGTKPIALFVFSFVAAQMDEVESMRDSHIQ